MPRHIVTLSHAARRTRRRKRRSNLLRKYARWGITGPQAEYEVRMAMRTQPGGAKKRQASTPALDLVLTRFLLTYLQDEVLVAMCKPREG